MAAKNPSRAAAARRRQEATEWFSLLLEAKLTPELLRQFQQWSSVRKNRQAFKQVELLWAQLDHVRLDVPAADGAATRLETPAPDEDRVSEHAHAPLASPASSSSSIWRMAAAGASAFLSISILAMLCISRLGHPIETGLGEWQHERLADGTNLDVGPASQLRIRLGDAERSIQIERGEVVFDVAKDPDRPFIVSTPLGDVQAIGTRFAVSTLGGPLVVTVAEGKVTVSPKGSSGKTEAPIPVTAGEQVSIGDGPTVRLRVDPQRRLAWAQGVMIDMSGETIGDVVRELNRRNRVQIIVADDSIAEMRPPVLRFRPSDPEFFMGYLASLAPVELVRDGPDRVRIEKAETPPPQLP